MSALSLYALHWILLSPRRIVHHEKYMNGGNTGIFKKIERDKAQAGVRKLPGDSSWPVYRDTMKGNASCGDPVEFCTTVSLFCGNSSLQASFAFI